MGLFGGGNTKRTTINEDNRIINDYSGSSFEQDNSNNGQFAGVGGNVDYEYTENNGMFAGLVGDVNYTTTDSGAFEIVSYSNANMAQLAESLGTDAQQLGYELGVNSLDFAGAAINENAELTANMLDRTLSSIDSTVNNASFLIDNTNERTLDAALNFTQASVYQNELSYDFARDLVSQNGEAVLAQQQDNNSALTNGFKSMMQFADSFSRSDGASIAESNNKMIMMLAGGLVVSIFIFKKLG